VVPHLNINPATDEELLEDDDLDKDDVTEVPETKKSSRGRVIKPRIHPEDHQEKSTRKRKQVTSATKTQPLKPVKSAESYNTVNTIKARIDSLKAELSTLRSNRSSENQPKSKVPKLASLLDEHSTSLEPLTAEDIRDRYRRAVGLKTKHNITRLEQLSYAANHQEQFSSLSTEEAEQIYVFKLNSLVLQGSPDTTASYFVDQMLDSSNFETIPHASSRLDQLLTTPGPNKTRQVLPIVIFNGQAFDQWQVDVKASEKMLEPLKKLESASKGLLYKDQNQIKARRPRERFLAERRIKWLEPEFNKWRDKYLSLRKYRKQELSKDATLKMKRLKRNARRKKRRDWIKDQIKAGKMHKSALIWVNSTKILPFERQEKKLAANIIAKDQDLSNEDVINDDTDEFDDDVAHDDHEELDTAVASIQDDQVTTPAASREVKVLLMTRDQ
jgi:hypothetical protein